MTNWHLLPEKEVLGQLGSSIEGLKDVEAAARLKKYGFNEIERKRPTPAWKIFARQFYSFLVLILIAATIISLILGFVIDAIVIFAIVLLNSVLGFTQEWKAEKTLEALQRLAAPKAKVVRGGKTRLISARELVIGDVVLIEAGDRVPADIRLLEVANFQLDEASLTGESTPVEKLVEKLKEDAPVAERKNMAFGATLATYGRAKGVVVATANMTEFGKIAKIVVEAEEKPTPLLVKLQQVGRLIGYVVIAAAAIIFAVSFLREFLLGRETLAAVQNLLLTSISLAVAAVPEGLPAVITIALALGLQRMARKNSIVRKLPAVEALGSTTVICADKTGTLTKNEMTVRRIFLNEKVVEVSGEGWVPRGEFNAKIDVHLEQLLKAGALCNDSSVYAENKLWKTTGDPTEAALVVAAMKAGIDKHKLEAKELRVNEIPFDSERKRMTTVHRRERDFAAYVKGAPEVIIKRCASIYKGGKVVKITKKDTDEIYKTNEQFANSALRVLALAYRPLSERQTRGRLKADAIENDLIFLGLVGMIDPPRAEVKDAIVLCKQAGVKVVMTTGDHATTAAAIAREIGVTSSPLPRVVTGAELDKMSEEKLDEIIEDISVFARIDPLHKVRIVRALKKKGHIVAMTGDGVNDAPALKEADIGVAMGIKGTDVAKEASDMVLEDDNFATIVAAVEEGRGIFDNIRKFVNYLLSSNAAEVLTIFLAAIIGLPLPLVAIHLLWINLLTDGLPAVALAADPKSPGVMSRPPRNPAEPIIHRSLARDIAFMGGMMTVLVLALFVWTLSRGQALIEAQTVALASFVAFEMARVQAVRAEYNLGFFTNRWLLAAIVSSLGLLLLVIYVPPLAAAFKTAQLDALEWGGIIGASLLIYIVVKLRGLFKTRLTI